MGKGLFPYPLTAKTVHLCLDMQRIFAPGGPWAMPWMERVLPVVASIASRFPERTVFTRFITPQSPGDMPGMWQRYYSRWKETTRERINPALLELLPPLSSLSPPVTVIDKTKFSGFAEPQLLSHLQARGADGLVITGSETDVCVLGTVLRHHCTRRDLQFFRPRPRCIDGGLSFALSEQIETANADEILDAWS
jgi:nicotinamidase-related amidase